jgi:2-oxoglutarate dehydrogenase E1 component
MQVVNCTTPAQYFHVLRRQMRRNFRAPLVVFTPKSLLRAPRAASRPDELAQGRFEPVLGDPDAARAADRIRRVLVCSGKVYYELLEERERRAGAKSGEADQAAVAAESGVAMVRAEQLYPWQPRAMGDALAPFARAEHFVWVQEEPRNMGAWTFVRELLEPCLPAGRTLAYAGRDAYAAPAGGSMRVHRRRQSALIARAFGDDVAG